MILEKLTCPVQHYAWGERNDTPQNPLIPRLLGEAAGDAPWAEMWIGAHPKAPSVLSSGESLADLIALAPQKVLGAGKKNLPYLLKVLCCVEPLSIQSHPDRETAARLHKDWPEQFPDDNHKPEILIALTDFQIMAGFRELLAIQRDLSAHPSLLPWYTVGGSCKDLCQGLFAMPDTILEKMQQDLLKEIHGSMQPQDCLFRVLSQKYPGDCGCFFAYLLNLMTLRPGEAVHVPANTPHAYLKGEGIECMANSDNVIRAGLTPKVLRKDLLMETLRFEATPVAQLKIATKPEAGRLFSFACEDFRLEILQGLQSRPMDDAALYLVLDQEAEFKGDGWCVTAPVGSAWFTPVHAGNLVLNSNGRVVRVW